MIKLLPLALVSSLLMFDLAGADTGFENWKREQMSSFQQNKDEFEQYKHEINAAFVEYRQKTSAVWGRSNVDPDKTNWVSYIDTLNQRSVVDFRKGKIDVEVALPAGQKRDDNKGRKQLEQTLLKALKSGGDRRPIQEIAKQPVSKPDGRPVLEGQISLAGGAAASPEDYVDLAHDAASHASIINLRGNDGVSRTVYRTTLDLVPDHIRIRAVRYKDLVNQYATEHKIPAAIIFAVIETESMFNPTARSAAPAFGLMQLVPTSGARDAYRYLYNRDKVVTDTYLYDPENNIRLGSAYLRRVNTGYLDGIKSDESRMLATIAAYNTGAGNVLKAFAGRYSSSRYSSYSQYKQAAFREINQLTPAQVYQHLRNHLPYRETREYIRHVTQRMNKYTSGL